MSYIMNPLATSPRSSASSSLALSTRLNARLDANSAQQLHYLVTRTGLAVSDVVRLSLENFYNTTRRQTQDNKAKSLDALIDQYGSEASSEGTLSTNYKAAWANELDKKYAGAPQAKRPSRTNKALA
jgi:hypothetical protein